MKQLGNTFFNFVKRKAAWFPVNAGKHPVLRQQLGTSSPGSAPAIEAEPLPIKKPQIIIFTIISYEYYYLNIFVIAMITR
jgi:hypothetical protein